MCCSPAVLTCRCPRWSAVAPRLRAPLGTAWVLLGAEREVDRRALAAVLVARRVEHADRRAGRLIGVVAVRQVRIDPGWLHEREVGGAARVGGRGVRRTDVMDAHGD